MPDHATQVVAIDLWLEAGSKVEPAGKRGLARLFERLMVTGGPDTHAGRYTPLIDAAGGTADAEVDEEFARYRQVLPSNRLELGLWLEAGRLRTQTFHDAAVASARTALLEELARSAAADPYARVLEQAAVSLYDSAACPGYRHLPAGAIQEIRNISATDAAEFFRNHYTPSRARLVIAGDLDPARTRNLVEQYFGPLLRGPEVVNPVCTMQPVREGRRERVTDRSASRPAAALLFPVPPHDHPDAPALELLSTILGQGRASRLAHTLIRERGLAIGVRAGNPSNRRVAGSFILFAVAGPGTPADTLAARLSREALWAAGDSLGAEELTRAKRIYLATLASGRERMEDVAEATQHAQGLHRETAAVNREPEAVLAVTVEDLRRVARAWLQPVRALTLLIEPEPAS